jgi:hypothetical protein
MPQLRPILSISRTSVASGKLAYGKNKMRPRRIWPHELIPALAGQLPGRHTGSDKLMEGLRVDVARRMGARAETRKIR